MTTIVIRHCSQCGNTCIHEKEDKESYFRCILCGYEDKPKEKDQVFTTNIPKITGNKKTY